MRIVRLPVAPLFLLSALCAQAQDTPEMAQARTDADRMSHLVASGVLPPARLSQAQRALADAQDDLILKRTLYGPVNLDGMTEAQSQEMLGAAQRRLERHQAEVARVESLVKEGVLARNTLQPLQEELQFRIQTMDLAQKRARLLVELTEMAKAEKALEEQAQAARAASVGRIEKFLGKGQLAEADWKRLNTAFQKRFEHALPVSAAGDTATHRSLGFDHRGRFDIGLNPDQPEGVWLREYLAKANLPYFAFRTAMAGKATGAHIHVGPPSLPFRGLAD